MDGALNTLNQLPLPPRHAPPSDFNQRHMSHTQLTRKTHTQPPKRQTKIPRSEMLVQWSTLDSADPVVKWGHKSGKLDQVTPAESHTYT